MQVDPRLTYKKYLLSQDGTVFRLVEVYPDGRENEISAQQDIYQVFVNGGGQTTVVPYVAPETPVEPEPPAEPALTLEEQLEHLKVNKINTIDLTTRQWIQAGFIHNGILFSLSDIAQVNWISMMTMMNAGQLTLPMKISTKLELGYVLQDETEFGEFIDRAFTTVLERKSTGVDLREQLMLIYNDAQKTTQQKIDEITALTDTRDVSDTSYPTVIP